MCSGPYTAIHSMILNMNTTSYISEIIDSYVYINSYSSIDIARHTLKGLRRFRLINMATIFVKLL